MSKLGAMHNVQRPRTETGEFARAGLLLLGGGDVKETFT